MFMFAVMFVALLSTSQLPAGSCSNILVIPVGPGFNSRLLNLAKMSRILGGAGHNVTFLVNTRVSDKVKKHTDHDNITTIAYSIPEGRKVVLLQDKEFTDLMEESFETKDYSTVFKFYIEFGMMPLCRSLLEHKDLLQSLKHPGFDLLVIDIADDCNRLLVQYFDFPTMLYSNYGFTSDWNIFYPLIPSFVRVSEANEFDYLSPMGFKGRALNMFIYYVTNLIIHRDTPNLLDKLRQEFNMNTSLKSADAFNNHVILANINFALQTPRPFMPHVIPLPGLSLEEAKPLTEEWRQIVESSPAGVIIVSFGTVNPDLQQESNEVMARVLGRLPHTVLWKHTGLKPDNLPSNIRLLSWFPQNDILAHPAMRFFITHCGISSTFEAAYHGVPVIAVPYAWEQFRNAAFMVDRAGIGEKADIRNFKEDTFEKMVHSVLNNTTFKENALHLSKLMKDNPVSTNDAVVYWTEYLIRHKGAKHLVSSSVFELSLFQYLSLDIALAALSILLVLLIVVCAIIYCVAKMLYRCFFSARKEKQS